jgi:hypothetical protein
LTENRFRARLSLGHYATIEERDRAIALAQAALEAPTASQEAPQRAIAADVLDIPANADTAPTAPLTLDLQRWIYSADYHAPLHNRQWIKRMALVAAKHEIRDLVIGGDFFDMASVSRHPNTHRQAGLNETLRIAGDLLVALCRVFDRLYILPGNHCRRVANKLDEPLAFDALIHAAVKGRVSSERIITTDRDYLYIGPQETGFVVGHPKFFEGSGVPGLAKAAMRERRHAIGSHTHACSLSWTHDGRHMVIYPGHLTDPDITPYIAESRGLSKFAEWRSGFVMVDNGIPRLFTDGLVDWNEYGSA